MRNKVEIKKFLGMEVRVVNDEYIVLKDMFNALGRVKSDKGMRTTDKNKLIRVVGEENVVTFKIEAKGKKHSRSTQQFLCVKESVLNKYDIIGLFGKGVMYTNYRDEYNFVQLVKDFFKYDDLVFIKEQFKVMEFRADLVIGNAVFVEFDEEYHNDQIEEDIDRMKKISLANTYDDKGYLHNTNDYKEQFYTKETYEGFTTYDFNGAFFIRVRDKHCLNWIPLVYNYYAEYIDFMNKNQHLFRATQMN